MTESMQSMDPVESDRSALRGRLLWVLPVALIGLLAAAVGCSSGSGPSPAVAASKAAPQAVAVTTAAVTPRPVQRYVQIVGTFYGTEEVSLTPKVEGRVVKILHDKGDVVRPGDVLLEIEDTDFRLAVAEAQRALELELAKLGLRALPKEFDVSKVPMVERAKYLEDNAAAKLARARRSGIGSTMEDKEQAETDYKVAQATYHQTIIEAQSTLAAARHRQAALEMARQKLIDTKVRVPDPSAERLSQSRVVREGETASAADPPVEYVVAGRMVSEGEIVRTMNSTELFRLVMDQPLKLLATVPERHVGAIKVGQPVEIFVEAYPGESFAGTVSRVNPTVDRANRTFQIEVLVPNESRQLRAGSFAKARVLVGEDPQATTIPETALVTFAGVIKVFAVEGDKSRAVEVRPGIRLEVPAGQRTENWLEVIGDLRPGDQVVTSGHSQLADGTLVRVRTAEGK